MRRCIGRENSSSAIDGVSWRKSEKLFKSSLLRYIKYGAIYLCVKTVSVARYISQSQQQSAMNMDAGEMNRGGGKR